MPWTIGISLGIGILVLLNQLQIPFILYYNQTTQTVLISPSCDQYLFLISSICLPITLALTSRRLSRLGLIGILALWIAGLFMTILGETYGIPALYLTVVCAAVLNVSKSYARGPAIKNMLIGTLALPLLVESSALFYWISSAINPQVQVGLPSEQLELGLTFALFPLTALMLLLLLFSWLWVPVIKRILPELIPSSNRGDSNIRGWNARSLAASLDLFAVLAILLFFYPYFAGQTWIVGVDSVIKYLTPLKDLSGMPPIQAFSSSYTHGLYLLFLYLAESASGMSSFTVVKYAPLILAFTGASVVFLAVQRGWGNFELSILSSLCTLLWLPTTIGIYAGIQANWLAFVLWMLFLSFYFLRQEWNAIHFLFQGLVSLAIFLLHPWTWGVFLASLGLTALISSRNKQRKRCVQGLVAATIIALPVGLTAYLFLPGLGQDFGYTMQLYSFFFYHPTMMLSFGGPLIQMIYEWGPFLSPILLLICVVGAFGLSGGGIARNYLFAWVVVWCVGSIMVAPMGYNSTNPTVGETLLWRMLYVSPLPILLALGIQRCIDFSRSFEAFIGTGGAGRLQHIPFITLVILCGAGLFVFSDPLVRLAIVIAEVASLAFFSKRFSKYQAVRVLVASLLILVLINAAYRSLYPLLLDPHNLIGAAT
ncbi:MAG TPA: hypothetical protein VJZ32_06700 [Candidatus Bathyarchaeia archaeon]|nr:hypothetical protein [Candidatus Bathyarchaeia archaeon]